MRILSPVMARLGPLAAATSTLFIGPAHAQVTAYTDSASFQAAAPPLTTFTFDGYAPSVPTFYPNGLTVQGVTFGGSVFVDKYRGGPGNPFGGHDFLETRENQALSVALPAGVTGFAADFTNYNSSSSAPLTALVNGQTFTFQEPGDFTNGFAFIGFTSNTPITSLSFSGGTSGVALDNVSYGPAAVPEASTKTSFRLLALGLGGVVIAARKKKTAFA